MEIPLKINCVHKLVEFLDFEKIFRNDYYLIFKLLTWTCFGFVVVNTKLVGNIMEIPLKSIGFINLLNFFDFETITLGNMTKMNL